MKSSRSSARPIAVALATAIATIVPLTGVSAPVAVGASGNTVTSSKAADTAADKAAIVRGRYIVMTKGAPLARYTGGVKGIARTKPLAGHKLNVRSQASRQYRGHLLSKHRSVLARAGVSAKAKSHDYSVAFNGFVAELTEAEVVKLGKTPASSRSGRTRSSRSTPSRPRSSSASTARTAPGNSSSANRPRRAGDHRGRHRLGHLAGEPGLRAAAAPRPDQAKIDAKWNGTCDRPAEEPRSPATTS